jgi:hypothetical protein
MAGAVSDNLKVETLAYALARARAFVKDRAEHPAATGELFQGWAQGLLADIDRALEGTIYAPAQTEDTE